MKIIQACFLINSFMKMSVVVSRGFRLFFEDVGGKEDVKEKRGSFHVNGRRLKNGGLNEEKMVMPDDGVSVGSVLWGCRDGGWRSA